MARNSAQRKKDPSTPLRSAQDDKRGKGRRGDEIQVVGFMLMPDGSTVPMEDLTPEQRAAWKESCCKRLSQRLSDYFTQHPEEYARV